MICDKCHKIMGIRKERELCEECAEQEIIERIKAKKIIRKAAKEIIKRSAKKTTN